MVRPPAAPRASQGRPSRCRINGHILAKGLAPAAIELGWPGRGSNHIMPLFIRKPPLGITTLAPKRDSRVLVSETMDPEASTTLICEVQPASAVAACPMVVNRCS